MKEEATALRACPGEATENDGADAAFVLEYLARNPDFFLRNEAALANIELPHRAGEAVSLVERQVKLLRDRNIESRQRLAHLLDTAHENDQLFDKTRQLILALLEADSLQRLNQTLGLELRREFDMQHARLLLIEDADTRWPDTTDCITRDTAVATLGGILRQERPIAGPLRPAVCGLLFGPRAEDIASALVAVVGKPTPIAVLALGSDDARRFHAGMGTLFTSFVADVLERLLPRWQRRD